ncbi:glycoside hydrolase family 28 protein [Aaosphaeria arxii CBS 175.79]|uniref:Glycoside hydrolase family 28 protein n=1 Tax=Aaosphaeria arxii CBS 175.79 TaxID=1450172 RepID=A0A6A5X8N3_9PLEO|nr:glycoside hydrolase family 28 protein [Aaosphaeria arxii CBS 175.79]KAF2009318.1 glycoside hydrolase family 28 protein [Aaosphaeria arxii CBS 175.79]
MKAHSIISVPAILAWLSQFDHVVAYDALMQNRGLCTPLAQGYEQVDDAPAINDALKKCGDGGTIVLPADQTYSIRTPIIFSPCRNCDVQIEGRLIIANDWSYWNNVDSTLTFTGVQGARVRSLTGRGVIDGNAISYYRGRWDGGISTYKPFAHITNGSTDIHFDNLVMKNVMHRFFRVDGQSSGVAIMNMNMSMEEQWGRYSRNEHDAVAIELGETHSITVSNVSISLRSRVEHGGTVGICLAIDVDTHNVTASDIDCRGAWGGALIAMNIIGTIRPTAAQQLDTISDILISNLTFDGDTATGFRSYGFDSVIRNIVWDGVTVINGNPATASLCWLKTHTSTPYYPTCMQHLRSHITDVWFKDFRGKVGQMPTGETWGAVNGQTVTEYHFDGWQNSTIAAR